MGQFSSTNLSRSKSSKFDTRSSDSTLKIHPRLEDNPAMEGAFKVAWVEAPMLPKLENVTHSVTLQDLPSSMSES